MTRLSVELREHALDLAWSLWAELGVSGWQRRHTSHAIDPEPLIIFTAWLADADPRLRDESLDWCVSYGRWVSAARFKNLLADEPEDRKSSFGWYGATVAAHAASRWPFATDPRRYRPTGRSTVEDFQRPSLIALRLRSLFGVTARAEILRLFIASPGASMTAADLAPDAGYTKRNVAEALEAFRLAGLVEVVPWRNQLRYRLAKGEELLAFAGSLPAFFPRWRCVLRVVIGVLELARRMEKLPSRVRRVEIDKALRQLEGDLREAGIARPDGQSSEDVDELFRRWALAVVGGLASGRAAERPWSDWLSNGRLARRRAAGTGRT